MGHRSCHGEKDNSQTGKEVVREGAGRGAVRIEESHRGKASVFDPPHVSQPPRLPLTICSPGYHLAVSGTAANACSIAIASSL